MPVSLDDLKAAVTTARDAVDAARDTRWAAVFAHDAAVLAHLQAQGELRDADPLYDAMRDAAQVSCLDRDERDRELLCDAVDAFVRSLRASGYDIVRRDA